MSNIKVCTLKPLPASVQKDAHRLAVALNPLNAAVQAGPVKGAMTTRKRWPQVPTGHVITVSFLDGSPTQRSRVEPYFHEWEKYANLKFVFISNPLAADIRVSFREGEGSWSYLGTDCLMAPKGDPTMVFGWLKDATAEDEYRRVVLHEVAHAIGFEHELQSPGSTVKWNIPRVIAYYTGPPNRWTEKDVYEQVINRLAPQGREYTPFDSKSIACYATPAEFTENGIGIPLNDRLSEIDKQFAAEMYPGKTIVTPVPPKVVIPEVVPGGAVAEGEISDSKPINEFKFVAPGYGEYRVWSSYVGGLVLLAPVSDPGNPLAFGRQQFTTKIPPGEYRLRVIQASKGKVIKYRINSRRLT